MIHAAGDNSDYPMVNFDHCVPEPLDQLHIVNLIRWQEILRPIKLQDRRT